jgi:hypothetical protein
MGTFAAQFHRDSLTPSQQFKKNNRSRSSVGSCGGTFGVESLGLVATDLLRRAGSLQMQFNSVDTGRTLDILVRNTSFVADINLLFNVSLAL